MKKKREQARRDWIKGNFGSIEVFLRKVFELRNEKPIIIRSRLEIPQRLWKQDRAIRQFREDAVRYMTKQELEKNPSVSSDDLWDKWKLNKIPNWEKTRRVTIIRGYDDLFEEAKKELVNKRSKNRN